MRVQIASEAGAPQKEAPSAAAPDAWDQLRKALTKSNTVPDMKLPPPYGTAFSLAPLIEGPKWSCQAMHSKYHCEHCCKWDEPGSACKCRWASCLLAYLVEPDCKPMHTGGDGPTVSLSDVLNSTDEPAYIWHLYRLGRELAETDVMKDNLQRFAADYLLGLGPQPGSVKPFISQ